jgi:hypothetical protein
MPAYRYRVSVSSAKWWVIGAAVLASAGAATSSLATTGASTGLPEPKVKVLRADGEPFEGRYVLTAVDRTAQITGGQIQVGYTETAHPYLVGFAEFASFDTDGRKSLWTANLYPFTYGHDKLSADVLSQASNDRLGKLVLDQPKGNRLTGTLTVAGLPHAVAFRKIDDDVSLHGKLPAVTQTAARPLARLTDAGWGAASSYVGRYRLASQGQAARASAAMYAPLVQLTNALSSDQPTVLAADLALRAGGGELTVTAPGAVQRLQVTDLRSGGDARSAKLRATTGGHAVVGHLDVTRSGDTLTGSITVRGKQTSLNLEQYTTRAPGA